MPRICVIIVTYNSERDVETCFGALSRAGLDALSAEVLVVDNASRDGTVQAIRATAPHVRIIESDRNLGFAGGNNLGIRLALERGVEFVFLLNPDTEVDPAFLGEAIAVAQSDSSAATVQSLVLLAGDRDRVNTAGNEMHFLGFGYCGGLGTYRRDVPCVPTEIAFASGAAMLLRASALRDAGAFDDEMFLYNEDLDLGWRLRLAGYRALLAPRSIVWHRYEFLRNPNKYYFIERNRYLALAKNLRLRSLAVLFPLLLLSELGMLLVAAASGWLPEKLRADAYLLRPATWRHVRRERARVVRRARDRDIALVFTHAVEFEGAPARRLVRLLDTPARIAWRITRRLLA